MLHLYDNKTGTAATAAKPQDFVNWETRQIDVPSPIKTNNNLHHLKTRNSLIDLFNKYFEVVPADTPEKLLQAYRLRYEVYCKEALIPGFHTENYPEGLEYDQYDERSVHSLLMHKPSGLIAGAVRIILPDQDKLDTKFPVEKVASDSFYSNIASLKSLSRSHLGEISRLILAPRFRKRLGENWHQYIIAEDFEYLFQPKDRRKTNTPKTDSYYCKNFQQRTFPHAILGLFAAILQMSVKHDLKYWYAGMEPGFERFCRIFGINFTPISPIFDYYGPCRSYLGYIPDIMKGIYWTSMPMWTLLTNDGMLIPRPNNLTMP